MKGENDNKFEAIKNLTFEYFVYGLFREVRKQFWRGQEVEG